MSSFPLNNSWQNANSGSFFPPALPLPNSTASTNALAMQVLNQGSFHVPSFQFIQPLSMSDIFAPLVPLPLSFQNVNSDHNGPLNLQAAPASNEALSAANLLSQQQPLPLLHAPSVPLPPFFYSVNSDHNGLLNPQVLPILNASFSVPNQPLVQPVRPPSPDSNRLISGQEAVRYIWDQAANGALQNGRNLQGRSESPVLAQIVPTSAPQESQEPLPFVSEEAIEKVPPSEKRKEVKVFRKESARKRRGAQQIYEVETTEVQKSFNEADKKIQELLRKYKEDFETILKEKPASTNSDQNQRALPVSAAGFNSIQKVFFFMVKGPRESKYTRIGKGKVGKFLLELETTDQEVFLLTKRFFSSIFETRKEYYARIKKTSQRRLDGSVDDLLNKARSEQADEDPIVKRLFRDAGEELRHDLKKYFDSWKKDQGKSFPEDLITGIQASIANSNGQVQSYVNYKLKGFALNYSVGRVVELIKSEYNDQYIDYINLFSNLDKELSGIRREHEKNFKEKLKEYRSKKASSSSSGSSSSSMAAPSQPNPVSSSSSSSAAAAPSQLNRSSSSSEYGNPEYR